MLLEMKMIFVTDGTEEEEEEEAAFIKTSGRTRSTNQQRVQRKRNQDRFSAGQRTRTGSGWDQFTENRLQINQGAKCWSVKQLEVKGQTHFYDFSGFFSDKLR